MKILYHYKTKRHKMIDNENKQKLENEHILKDIQITQIY